MSKYDIETIEDIELLSGKFRDILIVKYSPEIIEKITKCACNEIYFVCESEATIYGSFKCGIFIETKHNLTLNIIKSHRITLKFTHTANVNIMDCNPLMLGIYGQVNVLHNMVHNLLIMADDIKTVTGKPIILEQPKYRTSECNNIKELKIRVDVNNLNEYHEDGFNAPNLKLSVIGSHEIDMTRFNFDKVKKIELLSESPIIFKNNTFSSVISWTSRLLKDFEIPYMPNLKKLYICRDSYIYIDRNSGGKYDNAFIQKLKEHIGLYNSLTPEERKLIGLTKNLSKVDFEAEIVKKAIKSNCLLFQNLLNNVKITIVPSDKTTISSNLICKLVDMKLSGIEVKSARKV